MSKDQKTTLKLLSVFETPELVKASSPDKKTNLFNQTKNYKGVFVDPYIVIGDYDTKLIHVVEKAERKSTFPSFDEALYYVKGVPVKNSPLALVGADFDQSNKILKAKFYLYQNLSKVAFS